MAAPPLDLSCATPVTWPGDIYITDNHQVNSRTDQFKTTKARDRNKRLGLVENLRTATWNVRGLTHKEEELQNELKRANVDICLLTETKKKMKGTTELKDYILLYSGVAQTKRASAATAILVKKQFRNKIHSYNFVSERIMNVRLKTARGHLTVVCIYAPEKGRKEESAQFYECLQTHMHPLNKTDL